MTKYRLLTNSEGKYRAQFNDALLPVPWGWKYVFNPKAGQYQIEFDSMEEALEIITKHKAVAEASRSWTVIDCPVVNPKS